jgi:hypothetical protein
MTRRRCRELIGRLLSLLDSDQPAVVSNLIRGLSTQAHLGIVKLANSLTIILGWN